MLQIIISEENKVRQNKSHPDAQDDVILHLQTIFRGNLQWASLLPHIKYRY